MINGFACFNPKEAVRAFPYEPGALGDAEVEIRVSHCGICHSDIHLIDNDWKISSYPFIPGHEIVGTITVKGKNVTGMDIGTRVGVGWQCNSCGTCAHCTSGNEPLCSKNQATCVGHHGGYADAVRSDYRFAIPLPDSLDSASTAPLLCGGITVYNPFRMHKVREGMTVGVVGIGGLGHLGLQFAKARGCHVTALSRSANKAAEAESFGAEQFLLTNDQAAMRDAANSLDFILVTASADVDVGGFLSLLKPFGKICVVGALPKPMQISASDLIHGYKSVVGSVIGSPSAIREMLDVAAKHKVAAKVETVPMADVNQALDKVRANQARYRMVLTNQA